MKRCLCQRTFCRWERPGVALLLCLGFALRLTLLGAVPRGLNQDEASAGYEALALLRSGMDRNGSAWPLLFISWGSGQNVLMSYLVIPFFALLGPTELALRLPNALCGCLTLVVFWRLARRARGPAFGAAALFVLCVNPWHIMMSRWALESNLLPFFLLLGIDLTALSEEHPWALPGAAAAFGLSLYAYGTAFFFLPLFLPGALLWLRRSLRPAPFLTALALFALLAAPIGLCQLRNMQGREAMQILGFTLPRLTEGRQAATSVFGGASPGENLRRFYRILLTQQDGLSWNALPLLRGGIFYVFGLPAAVWGFFDSLLFRKDHRREGLLRWALGCGFVCAALITVNINRINLIWLPLLYFSALGLYLALRRLRRWAALPVAVVLACCVLFCGSYHAQFGGKGNVNFFPGLGQAIRAAAALDAGTVYVTDWVNQPYIFALLYTETPPETFAASVAYRDADAAFRQVERFSGFAFDSPADCAALVLHRSEAEGYRILGSYGDFVVCAREPLA